jgi:hypothetical protein
MNVNLLKNCYKKKYFLYLLLVFLFSLNQSIALEKGKQIGGFTSVGLVSGIVLAWLNYASDTSCKDYTEFFFGSWPKRAALGALLSSLAAMGYVIYKKAMSEKKEIDQECQNLLNRFKSEYLEKKNDRGASLIFDQPYLKCFFEAIISKFDSNGKKKQFYFSGTYVPYKFNRCDPLEICQFILHAATFLSCQRFIEVNEEKIRKELGNNPKPYCKNILNNFFADIVNSRIDEGDYGLIDCFVKVFLNHKLGLKPKNVEVLLQCLTKFFYIHDSLIFQDQIAKKFYDRKLSSSLLDLSGKAQAGSLNIKDFTTFFKDIAAYFNALNKETKKEYYQNSDRLNLEEIFSTEEIKKLDDEGARNILISMKRAFEKNDEKEDGRENRGMQMRREEQSELSFDQSNQDVEIEEREESVSSEKVEGEVEKEKKEEQSDYTDQELLDFLYSPILCRSPEEDVREGYRSSIDAEIEGGRMFIAFFKKVIGAGYKRDDDKIFDEDFFMNDYFVSCPTGYKGKVTNIGEFKGLLEFIANHQKKFTSFALASKVANGFLCVASGKENWFLKDAKVGRKEYETIKDDKLKKILAELKKQNDEG